MPLVSRQYDTNKQWLQYAVTTGELGYNVMKRAEYFVSL
jgi:hypothetical protein